MKRLFYTVLFSSSFLSIGQISNEPVYTSWDKNEDDTRAIQINYDDGTASITDTSQLTIKARVQRICYSDDTIFVKTQGLPDTVGAYTNPGDVVGNGFMFKFPRNPIAGTGLDETPEEYGIGTLINGVIIFGLGDGKSYDNKKVWIGEAYYSEGETLDDRFAAHRQQDGVYHSHATPRILYEEGSSVHSPIVGWAFDGYPIYGPYAYSDSMNAGSSIVRMESNYELTTATDRTTMNGQMIPPPDHGPDFTEEEAGAYIQDYDYSWTNGGHLDEHNGRWCVTPEYPSGTYAYFVTIDAAYKPVFPYYLGTTYYGTPIEYNYGSNPESQTVPDHATCAVVTGTVEDLYKEFSLYPNPTTEGFSLEFADVPSSIQLFDNVGTLLDNVVITGNINSYEYDSSLEPGAYHVILNYENASYSKQLIVK